MTVRRVAPPSPPTAVVLLTVAWLLLLLGLGYAWFGTGMESWADHHSNSGARQDEIAKKANQLLLGLALTGVGGPVLIAVVAFAGRLRWTGVVFTVLAIVFCGLSVPLAGATWRELNPPQPVPTTYVCQERSGGDTRCPGG
ncbi:DUF6234 family protein [Phytohabitans houttuyneae]|uniref:DUF6234 family protein n=1 Tax=Phytohabitans houttuyneae TaxID=1076126 RepID=UPI00156517A6|nr:DUF6234 family protein [Phytohabitans houttuyneae]